VWGWECRHQRIGPAEAGVADVSTTASEDDRLAVRAGRDAPKQADNDEYD